MKVIQLKKYAEPEESFEFIEKEIPSPAKDEVLIKSEGFGLNFADVLSRQNMYRDAPDLPAVLGYEVVGQVVEVGEQVTDLEKGQRVIAFTRFGAYAEYVATPRAGVTPVGEDVPAGEAVALATQYCTAWYASREVTNIFPEDVVLIHSAAGGVGTALVQIAKETGCKIIGTAGSSEKFSYMKENGVDHCLNYRSNDFEARLKELLQGAKLDVVFDSLGGSHFKRGYKMLGAGGRIVGFGASTRSGKGKNIFQTLRLVFGYGFFHPAFTLMKSKSILGVYMLPIADYKPQKLQRCLQEVVKRYEKGVFKPHVGKEFKFNEIASAHKFLQSGRSIGKIFVRVE